MRSVIASLLLPGFLLPPAFALGGETFHPEKALFESFPREIPRRGSVTFVVTLKPGFRSPVIVLTEPEGDTRYERPSRMAGARTYEFDVEFRERVGAFRVELVVDCKRGDTTAAQFTVWVGVPRPEKTEERDAPRPQSDYEPERRDESTIRLERKLFDLLNAYRVERGLEPYPWLEKAAHLAREHMRGFLALRPRPDKLTHQIPGHGFIADRFRDVFAWPMTVRKFPVRDPNVGPEAVSFCSESLASPRSLTWLFEQYFLRESAFRAPVVSSYPTHAAVGIIRDEESGRLYTATVYVQVNSTRVLREIDDEWADATKQENLAGDGPLRAELLRRLGRIADPRSRGLFRRRLSSRDAEVRAAALDAIFLGDPDSADKWVERQAALRERSRDSGKHARANGITRTFAAVCYDAATRIRGEETLRAGERLAIMVLAQAKSLVAEGELAEAHATLSHLASRVEGLPLAEIVAQRLMEIEADPRFTKDR